MKRLWRTHSCVLRRHSCRRAARHVDKIVDAARRIACATILVSFPALLPAQTVPLLTTEEFTSEWKVSRDFIIAVAEKMPGERSFREQMIHLAGAAVLNFLETAFDDVLAQLAKVTPEHLTKTFKVDWKGRPEVTGRQMMLGMFVHTAHHRAQCEVYLRVKGIVPPDDLL